MGQGFLGLLLQDPLDAAFLAQAPPLLLVVLKVVPGHLLAVTREQLKLLEQVGDAGLIFDQIEGGQIATETALHQLLRLGQLIALQQVEHHAVAGGELAHQGIGGAGGQLARLAHPLKPALHRDHIALGIKAPAARPAGHLQEFTPHQGAMAPFGALA